jgi:DUF2911 family protein
MMRAIIRTAAATALVFAAAAVGGAQTTTQLGTGGGGSPHVKTDWTIGTAHISISYGRPSLKGRSEATLMPTGKPWRTGADEATVLTTDKRLTFGSVALAPGSYTINTVPGTTSWQLILGKLGSPKQWGIPYKKDLEIGRAPMRLGKTSSPVEQVTITIVPDRSASGGLLRIEWGSTSAETPFVIGS